MLASQASPPQLQEPLAAVLCSLAGSSPDSCMLMLQAGLAKCAASLLGALSSDELKAQVATLIQHIAQRLPQAQVRCSLCSAHGSTSAACGLLICSFAVYFTQSPHCQCRSCTMALMCTEAIRRALQGDARPAIRHQLSSGDAVTTASAVQGAFQDAGAVPALLQLLQLGPDHSTAGAAARALLVLLYDFHRAPAWL